MTQETNSLQTVVSIQYLDDTNAVFQKENGFLSLKATLADEEGNPVEKTFERVFLHNAFPFDMPKAYISVLDADQKEIGMIRDLSALSEETARMLSEELHRKYYAPKILRILSVKERYGFSFWQVELKDAGPFSFTVRDTYRSILRVDGGHLFITDVDGNRFEIEDAEALDRASFKKIELYL